MKSVKLKSKARFHAVLSACEPVRFAAREKRQAFLLTLRDDHSLQLSEVMSFQMTQFLIIKSQGVVTCYGNERYLSNEKGL